MSFAGKFSKLGSDSQDYVGEQRNKGDEEDQNDMVTISLFSMGNENSSRNIGETKMSKNRRFNSLRSDSTHSMDVSMDIEDDGADIVFRQNSSPNCCSLDIGCQDFFHKKPRLFGGTVVLILCLVPIFILVGLYIQATNSSMVIRAGSSQGSEWDQYAVITKKGAVATDAAICSQIGAKVLSQGGNAMDATVASALCLGVVSPSSSGIGGGCYILTHNATSGVNEFVDSRERAPAAANETMFVGNPMKAQVGGLAIAVLAEVRGLYLAWSRYGSHNVPWRDLVTPAAELAAKWTISTELGFIIETLVKDGEVPVTSAWRALYSKSNGKLKVAGDTVEQPELSRTLYQVADNGPEYIYDTMAAVLAAEIASEGGIVTEADIRGYEPTVLPALETSVFGHTYVGVGGSSSGGAVVAGILKFMSHFSDPMASLGTLYHHRLAEAFKHCFAIRLSLGDPLFVNTTGALEALLSDDYMAALVRNTSDEGVHPLLSYGGKFNAQYSAVTDHGTSHLSVMDQHGNAVAMTTTVNLHFGSHIISPSTGILFNNQMDDFSIPGAANYFGLAPSPFNFPEPHKRPLSSMSPSILLNRRGQVRLVGGASGGPRIITATAQVILNYFGRGMDLLSAFTSFRIHTQLLPDAVDVESNALLTGLSIIGEDSVLDSLRARGHRNVSHHSGSMGVTQFIAVDPDSGEIEAVSDPRKYGAPAAMV